MAKSPIPWNKFGAVKNCKCLEIYLGGREYEHWQYCHYTSVKVVDSILEKQGFWISCVAGFNDTCDSGQFGEAKYCYSLCFSTGIHENLALWYLYAGIGGKGARISLTKTQIKKLIEESTYELWEKASKKTSKKVLKKTSKKQSDEEPLKCMVMELERNNTMKVTFQDVMYYGENQNNGIDLKYNTMTNHAMPKEEWEQYKEKHIGFCKDLIWYYEKETRLVVELIGEAKRKIDPDKDYVIVLKFSDEVYKKLRLMFAPEIGEADKDKLIDENAGIKQFVLDTSSVKLSDHAGKVKMDLCRNCAKK